MAQTILVIGAGVAGLNVAMALAPAGYAVTLLERDGPPPEGDADAAFADWSRRGVAQLRQSHAFLARLREIIRVEHPRLREMLLEAGVRELGLEGMLSPMQRRNYKKMPEDDQFTLLTSRRTTLELIMRRYVETMPGVEIRPESFVRNLIIGADGAVPVVMGVELEDGTRVSADLVIDAGGRNADFIHHLREAGAAIPEENENSGILYYTRHYRLKPGLDEPPREGNPPTNGDLGFLKLGVFPGDNRCFSITLCTPEVEGELRKAIVHAEVWDKIIDNLPGLKVWTDRAEPTTKVFAMGDIATRWRNLAPEGQAAVLGYIPVGDNLVRTNPLYGRGCSFAAVGAAILRDVLGAESDPAKRLVAFQRRVDQELRPYFDAMRNEDRNAIKRAERELTPGYKPTLRARLMKSFVEDAIGPAMRYDINLLREFLRGFHMFQDPRLWMKKPANLARILYFWARGKKANAEAYPPKIGPTRAEMFADLGLDAKADLLA